MAQPNREHKYMLHMIVCNNDISTNWLLCVIQPQFKRTTILLLDVIAINSPPCTLLIYTHLHFIKCNGVWSTHILNLWNSSFCELTFDLYIKGGKSYKLIIFPCELILWTNQQKRVWLPQIQSFMLNPTYILDNTSESNPTWKEWLSTS